LAYAREEDIAAYATLKQFPIIPCNLCGSQDNLQRQHIKRMLQDWQDLYPGRIENMARALQNVVPSHLMDRQLHDFTGACEPLSYETGAAQSGLDMLSL
ncbi:MAG: tRNA 2-thiocytidine(32) synthetase TtcA, partial [Gammaproteobacteria bacterium]|nr:tRNA 2-thiocytidine(32) synthetase TtcA [Gammaproteobacteria bacterium]